MITSGSNENYPIIIDARGLEPPEPMVRVLERIDQLPFGKKMQLLIHREPRPLLRLLDQNGFDTQCSLDPEGFFRVLIWHRTAPLAPRS